MTPISMNFIPVFIVGITRSGTTALYLALQKHASFMPTRSRHGFDLTESRVFLDAASVRRCDGPAWDFLLHDEEAFFSLQRRLRRLPMSLDALYAQPTLQRIASQRALTRMLWWKACRRDALVRTYFAHAAAARGVHRLVEKTPDHLYRLREIRATFPTARILCTVRHPLDVFSSYRRRLAAAGAQPANERVVHWLAKMDASSFIGYYRSIATEAAHAAPALTIRYEEFTTAPDAVFRRICDFLYEPFDARCIEEPTPELRSFTQDPRLSHPIESNDKRWHDFITHDEATRIENALAEPMQRLGYDRRT